MVPRLILLALLLAGCRGDPRGPWETEAAALVVLVEWADRPAPVSREVVEAALVGEGSLSDWFDENSQGRFRWRPTVLDWVRSDRVFNTKVDCRPKQVLPHAWDLVKDRVSVKDHDLDRDGRIDELWVIHSGRGHNNRVSWRCFFVERNVDVADLVPAQRGGVFQAQGLGAIGDELPIGLFPHEAGHRWFRFDDQYGQPTKGKYGIGTWGLMGVGQWGPHARIEQSTMWRRPTHLAAPHKAAVGWVDPLRLDGHGERDLDLGPIEEVGGRAVEIPREGFSLWLENRGPSGFSRDLPGHGLLLWKQTGRTVRLIQADGRDDINTGKALGGRPLPPNDANFADAGDPFPGAENVTSWEGEGVRLSAIRIEGDRVRLRVAW